MFKRCSLAAASLLILLAGCDSASGPDSAGVPTMTSPAEGASNLSSALQLQWVGSQAAISYHAQVARDPAFSDLHTDAIGIDATNLAVLELQIGSSYYWHVRAEDMSGVTAWSPTWKFTVAVEAVAPELPLQLSPPDGSVNVPRTLDLRWREAPGASTYHIQVSQEQLFLRNDAEMTEIPFTAQTITELDSTYTYYWRVRAKNLVGSSPWSPIWKFVVEKGDG